VIFAAIVASECKDFDWQFCELTPAMFREG